MSQNSRNNGMMMNPIIASATLSATQSMPSSVRSTTSMLWGASCLCAVLAAFSLLS